MPRFTPQQIDDFLSTPSHAPAPSLTDAERRRNEQRIISRIHDDNVQRRTGWAAVAASVVLLIAAGIAYNSHTPTTDDTCHALYCVDDDTTADELQEQETLIACDTYLEYI